MNEFEDLDSFCSNMVTLKSFEQILRSLFEGKKGDWVRVVDLLKMNKLFAHDQPVNFGELYVTWLESVGGESDFAMIVFCEGEFLWSKIALYNVNRLNASK